MKTNFIQKTLSFELKITIAERLHWGKIVKFHAWCLFNCQYDTTIWTNNKKKTHTNDRIQLNY